MKAYITFGQIHRHELNGQIFDKDCVAVIEAPTFDEADAKAFELFDGIFHGHYSEDSWNEEWLTYYPRGYIEVKE